MTRTWENLENGLPSSFTAALFVVHHSYYSITATALTHHEHLAIYPQLYYRELTCQLGGPAKTKAQRPRGGPSTTALTIVAHRHRNHTDLQSQGS